MGLIFREITSFKQMKIADGSEIICEVMEELEEDIVLNVLPLSFDYGLYQLLMTFKFLFENN